MLESVVKLVPNTQVRTGEEAADGKGACHGGGASGPGSKSVHRTRSLGWIEQSRRQAGAYFFGPPPPAGTPTPPPSDFPLGVAALWRPEPRCDGSGRTFQTGPQHAAALGEEAADGKANRPRGAGPAGPGRNRKAKNACFGRRSRADVPCPRFSSTAPCGHPRSPPPSRFPPRAGRSVETNARAGARCVRRDFSNRAQHAGADSEEAAR